MVRLIVLEKVHVQELGFASEVAGDLDVLQRHWCNCVCWPISSGALRVRCERIDSARAKYQCLDEDTEEQ